MTDTMTIARIRKAFPKFKPDDTMTQHEWDAIGIALWGVGVKL